MLLRLAAYIRDGRVRLSTQLLFSSSNYIFHRGFLFQMGLYYPLFFFQLDSIKHGVGVTFSFYSVRSSILQVISPADKTASLSF